MAEAQPAQEDLRRLLGSLSEGAAVSNESIEAAALRAAAAVLKAESGGEDKAESDSEEAHEDREDRLVTQLAHDLRAHAGLLRDREGEVHRSAR